MPQYIVFIDREKRHEETLREYYQDTILGVMYAPNVNKALKEGAKHFNIGQGEIDVKAFRRSTELARIIAATKNFEKSPHSWIEKGE